MRVVPEDPEPESKGEPSPSETLAALNAQTSKRPDDGRLLSVPPEYAGLMYADYATSSGKSKITVGNGSANDVKTVFEALDDALFDTVAGAVDNCSLQEYLETGSLGQITEILIKRVLRRVLRWVSTMATDGRRCNQHVALRVSAVSFCTAGLTSPNINVECKCCVRSYLMRGDRVMHEGLQATQPCDTRTRAVSVRDETMHLLNDPRQEPKDVLLALVSKCEQDRDVASVYGYLKARATANQATFSAASHHASGVRSSIRHERRRSFRTRMSSLSQAHAVQVR